MVVLQREFWNEVLGPKKRITTSLPTPCSIRKKSNCLCMLCRERDIHHEDAVAAVAEDRLKKVSEYHRQDRRRLVRRDVLRPRHVSTEVMLCNV